MDPLHARLARLGLDTVASYGFVLAGGYAVQLHGFVTRPSEDIDLFTDRADPASFSAAVDALMHAFRADGIKVQVEHHGELFARLSVTDEQKRVTRVELGYDWRSRPAAVLEVGPVLHADDAVANKVTTLFGRAAPRDYIDVDAALASGRYSAEQLLRLAAEHDAGFDRVLFAHALAAVNRWPDEVYAEYGLSPETITDMRRRLTRWSEEITGAAS